MMLEYFETPTHTDCGKEISSHALNGLGDPIITLTEPTDVLEVSITVDSVEIPFSRATPELDFFTGPPAESYPLALWE